MKFSKGQKAFAKCSFLVALNCQISRVQDTLMPNLATSLPDVNNGPLVTIAVPTFNRASWLKGCVNSAIAQSYRNFELLVSDNASTDETQYVLKQLSDPRLRIIKQKSNIGLIPNWNACLAEAKGAYIVFLSDDDRIAPWMLERCTDIVRNEPQITIVLTLSDVQWATNGRRSRVIPSSKFKTGIWDGKDLLIEYFKHDRSIHMCGILIRTDALRDVGGFPLDLSSYGADTVGWVPLLLKGSAGFVNEPCATYSVHDKSETSKMSVNTRLNDEFALTDRIATVVDAFVKDRKPKDQIKLEIRRFFARVVIFVLCNYRERGGKLGDVLAWVWHFRRDLGHIGILNAFKIASPIAILFLPPSATVRVRQFKRACRRALGLKVEPVRNC